MNNGEDTDTDTAEFPPFHPPRPSVWIDVLIGLAIFTAIIGVCLISAYLGTKHV